MSSSPFFEIAEAEWIDSNDLAFAIHDGFPVTEGHSLVVTKRQVAGWVDATKEERQAVMDLVDSVIGTLQRSLRPDGFNVGFNLGEAAGQTVARLHVHVIPRYSGDVPDPTGGVRGVIPERRNYLSS